MSVAPKIVPLFKLPPNPGRLAEGGIRLQGEHGSRPWLSIVTIALNPGDLLLPTMESVLAWDSREVEYIVIDGGSTDGTRALLERHTSRINYWVSEPDQGISDAFNKGLSLCRGEVVGLINAGDWYEPYTLDEVRMLFSGNPEAGIVCGSLQFWKDDRRAYCCVSEPDLLDRDMTITHPTCFLRRALYLKHGGFSPQFRLAMDYELLLRLKGAGTRIVASRRTLANMIHDGLAEQNWRAALQETHMARQLHKPAVFYASLPYLWYLAGRKRVRFFLERFGFDTVIRIYREHISSVRKTR